MKRIIALLLCATCAMSATRYVRATGGSDAGDGTTFATGWATLDFAFSDASNATYRVVAGDTLRVCGDTVSNVFTLTSSWAPAFTTEPAINTPVYILGCDMTGAPYTDFNMVKITTGSTLANGLLYLNDAENAFMFFQNLMFNGGGNGMAATCITTASQDYFEAMTFTKCRFTNASTHGINCRMPASLVFGWRFDRCSVDNNGKSGTGCGINTLNNGRGAFYMYECSINNNDSAGVIFGGALIANRCLVYDNGYDGIRDINTTTGTAAAIDNCLFFSNTGDGLEFHSAANVMYCKNNIFANNSLYGVYCTNADMDRLKLGFWGNNCFFNNGTNPIDVNGNVPLGTGNITSNPLFADSTNRNFSLQSSSPCKNAGINPLGY